MEVDRAPRSRASGPSRPLAQLARDPHFFIALAAGPVVWAFLSLWGGVPADPAFPPALWIQSPVRFLLLVLAYPIVEEIVFRGWIQPAIAERVAVRALPGVSAANFITSTLFALAHLPTHPPAQALATFFPSLVFGHFRERHGHTLPAIVLHTFYNAGYFWLFPAT